MPTHAQRTGDEATPQDPFVAFDDHLAAFGTDVDPDEAQRAMFADIDRILARLETGIEAQKIAMTTLIERLKEPWPSVDPAPHTTADRG